MALLWVAKSEDGGAWDWARRYPHVVPGMDEPLVRDFFKGMDEQHHRVMGSQEHICKQLISSLPCHTTCLHMLKQRFRTHHDTLVCAETRACIGTAGPRGEDCRWVGLSVILGC